MPRIQVYWAEDMVSSYNTQADHNELVALYRDREYPLRHDLSKTDDEVYDDWVEAGIDTNDHDFFRYTPEQARIYRERDVQMVKDLEREWEDQGVDLSDEEWAELQELQAGARAYHAKLREINARR